MNINLKSNEVNIYACYHNLDILVLYNEDKSLKTIGKSQICLYIFENDLTPSDCDTKVLSFDEFIKEVKQQGFEYINYYYNGEDWYWHIDAVGSFVKESIDEFLKSNADEENKKYYFLKK